MVQHFNFLPKEGKKEAFTQYNDAKCSVVMREVVRSLEMDRREHQQVTTTANSREMLLVCAVLTVRRHGVVYSTREYSNHVVTKNCQIQRKISHTTRTQTMKF